MYFTLSSQLTGNVLSAEAAVPDTNQFTQYAYYLYWNGTAIQKQLYIDSPKFSFALSEPGKYYIRVFVRTKNARHEEYVKQSKNTAVHAYYPQEARDAYRAFLDTPSDFRLKPLPYQPYEYPYQDLFLAYDASGQQKAAQETLQKMGGDLGMLHTWLNPRALVLSQQAVFHEGKTDVAFSGMGRTDSRLIYGMSDIDSLACVDELSQQVGTFSLLRADDKEIVLGTDYYGTDKLYYLQHGTLFLISNRVHLLVLAMQALDIPRTPNLPHIYAYLADTAYTQQNFAQTLNIQGLLVLRSDSRVRIDLHSGQVSVEKTALYHALSTCVPYDQSRYEELVDKACGEIVDNLRIALEHPAFEQYVVHLTGGMDSRLVFCALTKLPQYKDKILVHTSAPSTDSPDLIGATRILSKCRYPFGTPQRSHTRKTTYTDGAYRALSITLGVTAEHTTFSSGLPYHKACVFPGAYGGALCRPCLSKQLRGTEMGSSTVSDAEFWSQLIDRYTPSNLFKVYDALNETFVKECLALPGATNLDKLDNHYLYYRNGLHFAYSNRFRAAAPFWGALQSKSLLTLKIMTSFMNYSIKVELDLTRHLNPEIASVKYEKESYEKERAQLDKRFGGYPLCQEYDEKVIAEILENWKENIQNRKPMVEQGFPQQENPYESETILSVFRTLVHALHIPEDVGYPIYCYLESGLGGTKDRKYNCFLRKLYSLYYELVSL